MGVSKNNGTPKWMVYVMENPMNKWMIWGYPYFWKQPYFDLCKSSSSSFNVRFVTFFLDETLRRCDGSQAVNTLKDARNEVGCNEQL